MTRLLINDKKKIVEQVDDSYRTEHIQPLKAELDKIGLEIYARLVSPAEQSALKKLAEIDERWITWSNNVHFTLDGQRHCITTKSSKPTKKHHHDFGYTLGILENEDLIKKLRKNLSAIDLAEKKLSEVRTKTKELLRPLTTHKQLLETWPEGKEFYDFLFKVRAPKLALVVVPEDLNKLLGLPR